MATPKQPKALLLEVQVCESPQMPSKMPEVSPVVTLALDRYFRHQNRDTLQQVFEGPSKAWLDQIT